MLTLRVPFSRPAPNRSRRDEMALVGLNAAADQLQIAREFAVLGDYDTARVY